MRRPAGETTFRLRIQLEEVEPAVWRRLLVPTGVRLSKLHDIIQATMGWTNSHLHSFRVGDVQYGMHAEDWPEGEIDESTVTVRQALGGSRRLGYEYDFGDSWSHDIVVEDEISTTHPTKSTSTIWNGSGAPSIRPPSIS